MSDTDPEAQRLLRAITADPSSDPALEAYADHLRRRGDPRGEWFDVRGPLEDLDELDFSPESAALHARADAFLRDHAEAILGASGGSLFLDGALTLSWRKGFVRTAALAGEGGAGGSRAELLAGMLRHPAFAVLERITMRDWRAEGEPDFGGPEMSALVLAPETLRHLSITHSTGTLVLVEDVLRAHPRLVELGLDAKSSTVSGAATPSARALESLDVTATDDLMLEWIATSTWPSLDRLWLRGLPGRSPVPGLPDRPMVSSLLAAVLGGERMPVLTSLSIGGGRDAFDLGALLDAPILPRLRTLRLGSCGFDDEWARELVRRKDAVSHLIRLEVQDRLLTEEGASLLRGLPLRVIVTHR